MTTKKCKHCGSQHRYSDQNGDIRDACMNCSLIESSLLTCVEALNRYVPLTGKPRKVTLIKYKISK